MAFTGLQLRHRVWLLVVVAASALVTTTAVTLVLGSKAEQQVDQVETQYVPLLEIDRDLKAQYAALERTLENAAAAGEESGLREADTIEEALARRLLTGADTIGANGASASELEHELRNYYDITRSVSEALVHGTPPTELAAKVERLQRARTQFERHLDVAVTPDKTRLTDAFAAARATQHEAFVLDTIVASSALVVMALLSWRIIRRMMAALHQVSMGMERLARGELNHPIVVTTRDELGELADEANLAAARLREYRELDEREAWIKTGLSELGSEIAGELDPVTLGHKAMIHVARYIEADVAVAYAGDEAGGFFVLDSYGVADVTKLPAAFRSGETILGQVARDDTIRVLANVSEDYLSVQSALGAMKPRSVVIVPLTHESRTLGLLELAMLATPTDQVLELLGRARNVMGSAFQVAKARQRTRELLAETQRQATELARTSRYKSEFLANMSHELRTPLNSIMILSKILSEARGKELTDKELEFAGLIHKSGEELLLLINDVLDIAKVESGRQDLVCAPVRVSEIIGYARGMFEPIAADKQLGFSVEAAADCPDEIVTDWKRLAQVLKNLLANAFKFTERGRVAVWIERQPHDGRDGIAIAVTDTGIGIPRDQHAQIFEAFAQVEAGTSRKHGGTGLGLTIARDLARRLGGDLVVDSEVGRGSRFRIILPVAGPVAEASRDRSEAATQPITVVADDRDLLTDGDHSILIIEDDPAFASVVAHIVREQRVRVLVAGEGREGLRLAKLYKPTGIVLDVGLPDMDGWSVMEALRSDPATRSIAVHFITASNDVDRAIRLGAVGLTSKPVDAAQVRSALAALDRAARVGVRRILVVEQDETQREALRSLLSSGGLEVESVGSTKEAMSRLAIGAYGCVVVNLELPDNARGLELVASIRTEPLTQTIPVVVHTRGTLDPSELERLDSDDQVIVVLEGERSKERVFEETRLFVHRMRTVIKTMPPPFAETAMPELAGKLVLIVDDDMRNVYSLSSALRAKNLEVLTATDGAEALDALERHPETNVVLMDVMMPRMDGHEATRRIRDQPRFRDLPIIALTAKTMPGEREKCIEAGASDYVPKPVDVGRLLALLRVWLT